jgi:hypothetical protein
MLGGCAYHVCAIKDIFQIGTLRTERECATMYSNMRDKADQLRNETELFEVLEAEQSGRLD